MPRVHFNYAGKANLLKVRSQEVCRTCHLWEPGGAHSPQGALGVHFENVQGVETYTSPKDSVRMKTLGWHMACLLRNLQI